MATHLQRDVEAELPGQFEPRLADVGDHDVTGPDVARDSSCHEPDRPGAGYQHILADERERQSGMHSIPKRVEDGAQVWVHSAVVRPHVAFRQHHVFGERPIAIYAETRRADAQVSPTGPAVSTRPADNVSFPGNEVSNVHIAHPGADRDHLAAKLVP